MNGGASLFVIEDPEKYRAALYIRLSKEDEQEGPSQSVTNQKSLLDEFAAVHSLLVYDTYVDDGWSGTNFDRPDFQRMVRDIEDGRINMVITKDLSRLGRDYILTGHYMERYFPEKRVRYISLLDGIDTGVESSANDITPFRAIMNDMYAKDISQKIKSVKRDKQRRGQFIGGKAVYGYKLHPTERNKIVVDEGAAPVVRRIFSMAQEGVSCRQIAVWLNNHSVPTPAAYAGLSVSRNGPYTGKWSSERISEMLQNETYTGSMVQGRVIKVSYKSKKRLKQPPEDWVVVAGTHEPIVSEEQFQQVQRLIQSRRCTRSRKYDYLLKGLIVCHECGYPLGVQRRKNAAGEDVLYFICRTYQRFTKAGLCTCHCIREKTVTDAVVAQVKEVCRDHVARQTLLEIAETALVEHSRAGSQESGIEVLRNKIEVLASNVERMYMDKLSGQLAEEDFERIYAKALVQRSTLEDELEALEETDRSPGQKEMSAEALVQRFWDSEFKSRAFLVGFVERVELTADKEVILKFRFCPPDTTGEKTAVISDVG